MAIKIGKGPYTFFYKGGQFEGVEDVTPSTDQSSEDIELLDGVTISVSKSSKVSMVLKIVDTGIDNLKILVPNAWLANNAQIAGQPTGTKVNNADGAIAFGAVGATSEIIGHLQILPAVGAAEHGITLFDGVAELTSFNIENSVVKAEVTVRSRATGVQMLQGGVTIPA